MTLAICNPVFFSPPSFRTATNRILYLDFVLSAQPVFRTSLFLSVFGYIDFSPLPSRKELSVAPEPLCVLDWNLLSLSPAQFFGLLYRVAHSSLCRPC